VDLDCNIAATRLVWRCGYLLYFIFQNLIKSSPVDNIHIPPNSQTFTQTNKHGWIHYLHCSDKVWQTYNFNQVNEFYILQGNAMTFFRYGGQVQNHLHQMSSGFRVLAHKKLSDEELCWCGYLSAAKCKWFAYGPADAIATPIISCFIKIQNGSTFLVPAYQGCPGKKAV